jgi:hypothetical protein
MTKTLLFMSFVTLGMFLRSRRFIELFPIFALLSSCWIFADIVRREVGEDEKKGLERVTARRSWVSASAVLMLVALLSWNATSVAFEEIEDSAPYNRYRVSAEWLARNTEAGTLVINADWDDFTRLFHFNSHNHYLIGLDPYFLFAKDPTGFRLWKMATSGELRDTPGAALARHFRTPWLFVDNRHKRFRELLDQEKGVVQVFDGGDSYVYKILQ